jgi:hypothetical protein
MLLKALNPHPPLRGKANSANAAANLPPLFSITIRKDAQVGKEVA